MRHKTRFNIILTVLTLGAVVFVSFAVGQSAAEKRDPRHAWAFMRQKLVYSQNALEGLTLGNYNLIITSGTLLWDMSQSNLWEVAYTDEYRKQSANYRDKVQAMVAAAQATNIAAARNAYGKTLQSCYDCHSHFLLDQMERHQNPKKPKSK